MDKRSDDIRQDIESTRASLDEKIDLLENKATGMVDQVKQTATDTIENVKQTFDVQTQVSERPWVALGLAVAAGYALGSLGGDSSSSSRSSSYSSTSYDYNQHANSGPSTMDTLKAKSGDFLSQFDDEIDLLKTAAVTTLTEFLRNTAREAVPALSPHIDRLLNERGLSTSSSSARSYSSPSSYSASGFTGGSSYSGGSGSSYDSGSSSYGSGSSSYDSGSSSSGSEITAGSSSGTTMTSEHGSFSRTSAPNASMDYESDAGKINNDAMPQMNRYGNPPPTPSRDDQDYYTTYQPGEDERKVGGGDKY